MTLMKVCVNEFVFVKITKSLDDTLWFSHIFPQHIWTESKNFGDKTQIAAESISILPLIVRMQLNQTRGIKQSHQRKFRQF